MLYEGGSQKLHSDVVRGECQGGKSTQTAELRSVAAAEYQTQHGAQHIALHYQCRCRRVLPAQQACIAMIKDPSSGQIESSPFDRLLLGITIEVGMET